MLPAFIEASYSTLTYLDITEYSTEPFQVTSIWTLSSTLVTLKLGTVHPDYSAIQENATELVQNLAAMSTLTRLQIFSLLFSFSPLGGDLVRAFRKFGTLKIALLRWMWRVYDGEKN